MAEGADQRVARARTAARLEMDIFMTEKYAASWHRDKASGPPRSGASVVKK